MKKRSPTQQISIRLPMRDHQRLVLEAEKQGATVAEIARQRIQLAEKQVELRDMLSSLLNHITKSTFVITSNVAGLNPDQIDQVKANIEEQLKRRLK
jgi:predicted DNA-binding protein